jgi:hypothetical protein
MSAQIIQLPHRTSHEPWLSKTQLADILGYSRRWVELQVAAGAPSKKLPNGQRRFRLREFTKWVEGRAR